MKNIFFLIIALSYIRNCAAQETTLRRHRLTDSVIEKFNVLKTNKNIRQGLYQAIYKNQIAVASGQYSKNKKIGLWHFYTPAGTLIENFNYTNKVIEYEAPDNDTSSTIRYVIDKKITDSDDVTKPIKPGGRYFGYIPFLKAFKLPDELIGVDLSDFGGIIELLVSPGGRLADFKIHILSEKYKYERVININIDLLDDDDKIFKPATFNHAPISSRIIIKYYITDKGELEYDQ